MQPVNYFTINGSNMVTPFSLTISPTITIESYSLKEAPEDNIMYIISKHIRKAYHNELGIINFNYFHRFIKDLTKLTKDDIITQCLTTYFGGCMYRLKEEPTTVISNDRPDYDYTQRKKGKSVIYKLIPGTKSLIEYALENNYNTDTFKSNFLRQYAMTTIDSTGCGIKKDENNKDVYIVGWKLIDGFMI